MLKANLIRLAHSLTVSIALVSIAAAQQSAASQASWAGWARCEIKVSGQGYSDQQTHTWMLSGGTPTVSGAFRVYPATWSVVGGGSLQRTQGNQTQVAQWATTAQNLSAPIAVFVRASDRRMFIQARHTQVRAPRSVNGYQKLTIDGKAQRPATIASEAFEWSFPMVEVSRPPGSANATANGSSTPVVNGKVGYMQPAGTQAAASCTWQFGQGSDAPAPPPTLTAQAIPAPAASGTATAPGTATPQPSGQPTEGAAACPSAPRNLVVSLSAGQTSYQWAAPASGVATGYNLKIGSAPGLANRGSFDTGSTALSWTVSQLGTGTYYFRIYALSGCGTSPASNEVLLVVP
jgi:hypothetical protein